MSFHYSGEKGGALQKRESHIYLEFSADKLGNLQKSSQMSNGCTLNASRNAMTDECIQLEIE